MCLILFAYDCHPRYYLAVAANRDEYHNRPTLPADFWPEHDYVLGGRDLKEGGTWMGVTTVGRFATLTNYRDPASFNPQARSRGQLVRDYLTGALSPQDYIGTFAGQDADFNGFNLLLGSRKEMYCYSNRNHRPQPVESGIHGLSNGLLDDPWPKVEKGKNMLAQIMSHEEIDPEDLFAMMVNREPVPDQELPHTGVSLEMERMLAPLFVLDPTYGTRTITVLLMGRDGQVRFWERSFPPGEMDRWNEVHYEF